MWVVWILSAVCLLVLVLCLVKKLVAITLGLALCIFFGGGCEPNLHTGIDPKYGNTVAYAGWTDDERVYENALNKDILQGKDGVHLPVYKVDTLEDFTAFKDSYGGEGAMGQRSLLQQIHHVGGLRACDGWNVEGPRGGRANEKRNV